MALSAMVRLFLTFFHLLLIGNITFTLGRPKRHLSAADRHNAMVKFAKEFQQAVQSGSVSRAVKMAKRAKRYKDTLHFGSYAFAAVLRGEDKILRAIFENAKGTFDINDQNKKTGGTQKMQIDMPLPRIFVGKISAM